MFRCQKHLHQKIAPTIRQQPDPRILTAKGRNVNERIELLRDAAAHVNLGPGTLAKIGLRITSPYKIELIHIDSDGRPWLDRTSLEGLRDCINCCLDTGSFAALADTSAVPYVGKRMRRKVDETASVEEQVVLIAGDRVALRADLNCEGLPPLTSEVWGFHNLLPLAPPAPRIRPYTAVEASHYIGRPYHQESKGGSSHCFVRAVSREGVHWNYNGMAHVLTERVTPFDKLAAEFVWADTGDKCGILEPQP